MRRYRVYCYGLILFVLAILAYNGLVWNLWNKQLLTREEGVIIGDLARIGYQPGHIHPRTNSFDLSRRHISQQDYSGQPVDVITLGDSFSNGGGGGRNRYYQDYIASFSDLSVLNIQPYPVSKNYLEIIAILANSGFLDEVKPAYFVLQLTERTCLSRLNRKFDLDRSASLEDVRSFYREQGRSYDENLRLPDVGFLNTGNLKFALYNIGYLFSDNAFSAKVYKVGMTRELFSGHNGKDLLFLDNDISKFKYDTDENIRKINDNLNAVAALLARKGIELVFLPTPNKYTLYSRFIKDNPYQESAFYERLRPLPRNYRFIDAKDILGTALDAGTLDIYFQDDTHWSWKAPELIFSQVKFERKRAE